MSRLKNVARVFKTQFALVRRSCSSAPVKEFNVSQFCSVEVSCPYDVSLQPLDVFQDQNKVVVNLTSAGCDAAKLLGELEFHHVDDNVLVTKPWSVGHASDALVNIVAPMKASEYVSVNILAFQAARV